MTDLPSLLAQVKETAARATPGPFTDAEGEQTWGYNPYEVSPPFEIDSEEQARFIALMNPEVVAAFVLIADTMWAHLDDQQAVPHSECRIALDRLHALLSDRLEKR